MLTKMQKVGRLMQFGATEGGNLHHENISDI